MLHQKLNSKEAKGLAIDLFKKVELPDPERIFNTYPHQISGGQKQRVAIARAMVSEPKVLLADEPTGALDSNTSKEVMDLIQKINKAGKTILVVTHEHDISQMCSRVVKLKDGVIVEDKKINQKKAL